MAGTFIENDLAAIFAQTDFAESVVLDGVTVTEAIFDDGDRDVSQGEGVVQIVPMPVVQLPTRHTLNVTDGSVVIIRTKLYRVANWKHDGTGVTELYLEGPTA
jgi:hypothetical protein